jgi:sulfide:quinone oxidoreductase
MGARYDPRSGLTPMSRGDAGRILPRTRQGAEAVAARISSLHVVVVGGGVAALEAVLALRKLAEERVELELVAPEADFVYRPLAVAEPFGVAEIRRFPLDQLVEEAGGRLRRGTVIAVDPVRHLVETAEGEELPYDVLLLALGAVPLEAVPGAQTFRGPEDGAALDGLLEEAVQGRLRRLVFAVPAGGAWPLPAYELALLTWNHFAERGVRNVELALVTPEDAPLALFGSRASDAVATLLVLRRIELRLRATPLAFEAGTLRLAPAGRIEADRVVALPRLEGPRLPGVAHDAAGFVPVDEYGQVPGLADVYAAGDLTAFPVKQGGIAAQQADTAAASIASRAGAPGQPTPFQPVLRGQLLTGTFPRYLRAEPGAGVSAASTEPLWWPPAKIVGRHLAPFLAARLGLVQEPPPAGGIPVDVALRP